MTETKDNSSLLILLAISGAVLLTVAGGWFLLGEDQPADVAAEETPEITLPDVDASVMPEPPAEEAPIADETSTDIDADLSKARMAAEADILTSPARQSALYFYGRVLAVEPEHDVANAELEAVLGRLSLIASDHLAAEEFEQAYGLAVLVARQRPDHELVRDVQQTLDSVAGALVEQAIEHAQAGADQDAADALAAAVALPGRNPNYYAAVAESIADIQQSRLAAEQDRQQQAEQAQQAAAQVEAAWVNKVQSAIAAGRLIAPPGDNAREFLAEGGASDGRIQQLRNELVEALTAEIRTGIESDQLPLAETLLVATGEIAGDGTEPADLREQLENAFVEKESRRVVSTDKLVRRTVVAPRYPRRATMRGVSGWVELEFTVTPSGETTDIEISQADPAVLFDDAAMDAIAQWTFEPKTYRGQLISQRAAVRLVFNLE